MVLEYVRAHFIQVVFLLVMVFELSIITDTEECVTFQCLPYFSCISCSFSLH